ncbi:GntR family transcriptional regulator [Mesorhizobium sp. IMUNJ 23232]|uniref:GntR family transcriptional regulator n=1 Tax=Mesorhizobium sp. IMUNJ 23232 TaxID=3376064 RepID=UPI0037B144C0
MNLAAEFRVDRLPDDRAQAIRDRLRDAIIDRRLTPGAKLSEAEVGTLFDVSRTIARSALQMLTFEGLVRTERNRGAFVANPSPEEAKQVFASRRLIEPGITTTACETIDARAIAEFNAQLDREELYLAARGPDARRAEIKASGDFHLLLATVAGNQILLRFMEELVARSSLVIALYGRSGVSACGHSEHREIVDALEARDVKRATALIVRHIDHIEADLELRSRPAQSLRDVFSAS